VTERRRRISPGELPPAIQIPWLAPPIRGLDHGLVIGNEAMETKSTGTHHIVLLRSREGPLSVGFVVQSRKAAVSGEFSCRISVLGIQFEQARTSTSRVYGRLGGIARVGVIDEWCVEERNPLRCWGLGRLLRAVESAEIHLMISG
jgi:hypothetical protein